MANSPDPAPGPGPGSGAGPEVVFLIPLISRARAHDWTTVQTRLAATLASLRAQTDPHWRALICCQDRPKAVDLSPPVAFLPYQTPDAVTPETATQFDNHAKRAALLGHLAATTRGRGYVFNLDADDLIHPGLVAHILADDNGAGYWIERGYMLDTRSGALAWLGPKSWRFPGAHSFIRECGSSAALPFDFRADPAASLAILRDRGKHAEWPARLARHGLTMAPVPFPAALYIVGHGENMRARRGKFAAKERYLRRNRLLPRAAAEVRRAFGLPEKEPR